MRSTATADELVESLDRVRAGRGGSRSEGDRWTRLAAVPPNFYAIAFGFAGLALTWRAAEAAVDAPRGVADGLFLIAAAVWAVLTTGLLVRLVRTPRAIAAELRDPALSPFMALPALVLLVLAEGLFAHAEAPARVIALSALIVVVALGGWLTGQWIAGDPADTTMHPAYLLPTVAGGLLGATVTAAMGYERIAWLCFGMGIVCWMQLGSSILHRLFTGPALPAALVPTLAIEVAPPAVAGTAYFALRPGAEDLLTYGLAGFCVLAIVVQLRLVPMFLRLRFAPTFWGFTFSYCAVATYGLRWIDREQPDAAPLLAWLLLALTTALVLAVAAKSAQAIARHRFFPV